MDLEIQKITPNINTNKEVVTILAHGTVDFSNYYLLVKFINKEMYEFVELPVIELKKGDMVHLITGSGAMPSKKGPVSEYFYFYDSDKSFWGSKKFESVCLFNHSKAGFIKIP